jgi:hypothetical protein
MTRAKKPDAIDWSSALADAAEQAKALRIGPVLGPVARCLCGSSDTRGRIVATPVDLTADDVTVERNEGTRPCQACQHGIAHGAMRITRHYARTTTVRDHFHPECVDI